MKELPDLSKAQEGQELSRERINWLRVDQLIASSVFTEEQVYARLDGSEYEDEIQSIISDLHNNQQDDLITQKGIGKVVQRAIDLDDHRDSKK